MIHEEDLEQKAVISWSLYFPELKWLYAVPNGAFLAGNKLQRAKQMKRLKAQGLKVGVSDLFLPVARQGYHGMYIEMKRRKGGVVSDDQKEFHDDMIKEGYRCVVANGCEEAIRYISDYMDLKVRW